MPNRAVGFCTITWLLVAPSVSAQSQPRSGAIEGVVVESESRSAVPGATVLLACMVSQDEEACRHETRTTSLPDGQFRFVGVAPGKYELLLVPEPRGFVTPPDGYAPTTEVKAGEVSRVELSLFRESILAGRVLDDLKRPIAGFAVSALRQNRDGEQRQWAQSESSSDGMFRIESLPPGTYYLRVVGMAAPARVQQSPAGNSAATVKTWTYYPDASERAGAAPIEVRPGQIQDGLIITIRQAPKVRVTGRVEPLPRVYSRESLTISLHPVKGEPDQDTTVLPFGPEGNFEFREVPTGEYKLKLVESRFEVNPTSGVRSGSRRLIASLDLVVGRNDIDDLRIRAVEPVSVAGRVSMDEGSLQTLKGLEIALQPVPLDGDLLGAPKRAAAGADGTFRITDCDPIKYTLQVDRHGDTYIKSISFNSQDVTSSALDLGLAAAGNLEIVLAGGGAEIHGTVRMQTREDGSGPQTQVVFLPADFTEGSSLEVPTVKPDKSGAFTVKNIRPGAYYAIASQSGPLNWRSQVVREQIKNLGQQVRLDDHSRLQIELTPVRLSN